MEFTSHSSGFVDSCQNGGSAQVFDDNLDFSVSHHSLKDAYQFNSKFEGSLLEGLPADTSALQELITGNLNTITPPGSNSPGYPLEPLTSAKTDSQRNEINLSFGRQQDKSSQEEDLARKKKAQNRAAQRAFRERKEAKLKELEEKLIDSERDKQLLLQQMEELKHNNLEVVTENKLLLEKKREESQSHQFVDGHAPPARFQFPSQTEFIQTAVTGHEAKLKYPLSTMSYEYDGEQLLTFPASWEYLHKLSQEQEFDVYSVMQKLKGQEVCHGHGPAYKKSLVDEFVRQSLI